MLDKAGNGGDVDGGLSVVAVKPIQRYVGGGQSDVVAQPILRYVGGGPSAMAELPILGNMNGGPLVVAAPPIQNNVDGDPSVVAPQPILPRVESFPSVVEAQPIQRNISPQTPDFKSSTEAVLEKFIIQKSNYSLKNQTPQQNKRLVRRTRNKLADTKRSGVVMKNSGEYLKFRELHQKPNRTFVIWSKSQLNKCDARLTIYFSQFARLKNVTVDRQYCVAGAKGGENLSQVIQQKESSEVYTMKKGCFKLACPFGVPSHEFVGGRNYLTEWLQSVEHVAENNTQTSDVIRGFTIAIARADYANIYWAMNDWYATFLMMKFFNETAYSTNILLVDAHPQGKLDSVWSTLFQSTRMLSRLPSKSVFTNMVWGLQGYNSVLKQNIPAGQTPFLIKEFRRFFLSRFHVDSERTVNCRNISVLFLWRRDYVAHPRNPGGLVQRKIANEAELVEGIQKMHPTFQVYIMLSVVLENLFKAPSWCI